MACISHLSLTMFAYFIIITVTITFSHKLCMTMKRTSDKPEHFEYFIIHRIRETQTYFWTYLPNYWLDFFLFVQCTVPYVCNNIQQIMCWNKHSLVLETKRALYAVDNMQYNLQLGVMSQQEALLPQTDRATRNLGQNLVNRRKQIHNKSK